MTHFSHEQIIKFCNRPFADKEEMDEVLIRNWNEKVPPNGLVFHLGDFAWGGCKEYKEIREKLNGRIVLIKGNHEFRNGCRTEEQYNELFEHTAQQLFIEIEGRKMYLNHVPFLCYGGTYRDPQGLVYQLFGHVHTSPVSSGRDTERLKYLFPTQYDVGVDNNNFTPISWYEVNEKIQTQIQEYKNGS